MEIWNAYDADFKIVEGKTLVRGEEIPQGLYHLVCDILVRHADGSYLIMRRDPRIHCGNFWQATAGGSALFGESPRACAMRELKEETGIAARDLAEVGRLKSKNTHYVEFLCVTDQDKDSVTLQEGETVDFRWVSKEELLLRENEIMLVGRMQQFLDELKA